MTVPAVHEQMHKRAGQQWEPNQKADHVRPVFGKEQPAGDKQKPDQHECGLGFHGHALSRMLPMIGMVLHRHDLNSWTSKRKVDNKLAQTFLIEINGILGRGYRAASVKRHSNVWTDGRFDPLSSVSSETSGLPGISRRGCSPLGLARRRSQASWGLKQTQNSIHLAGRMGHRRPAWPRLANTACPKS
jgi:hypothetical protein